MPRLAEDVDVLLYGATGYTGGLIARELEARNVVYGIAGRDPARLAALSATLSSLPPVAAVPADDGAGLEALARQAKVVISAAGPYVRLGPPVLEAALRAGTHFLDVTGEQSFLRWAADQDGRAREAGVTVVDAMGFDVVPSDIAALVSTTAMREVRSVDIAIWTSSGMSRGTRASMAENAGQGWWYDDGSFRRATVGRFARTFRFPDVGEKTGVFVPWGDCVTAPRSTGARTVRTFFIAKRRTAERLHRAWPLTTALSRTPLLRKALERKAASARDPTPEERAEARFAILAEAVAEDGTVQRGYTEGRDPYGFTAASVAHGAEILLAHGGPKGVKTPTQAFTFGPFAEAMKRFGFSWRARSLMAAPPV